MSMELNGAQREQLSDALRSAFTQNRLERMLQYRLDKSLEELRDGASAELFRLGIGQVEFAYTFAGVDERDPYGGAFPVRDRFA